MLSAAPPSQKRPSTGSHTTQNAYDALDRCTSTTYPDGSVVYYTYNTNNGTIQKIGSTSGGDQYLKSQTFNQYGLLTAKTVGNNVTLNYTYNLNNFRLTNTTAVNGVGTAVQNLAYSYNNSGMVTGIADGANSYNWTYTYDDLNRLTNARRGTGTTLGRDMFVNNVGFATSCLTQGPNALIGYVAAPKIGSALGLATGDAFNFYGATWCNVAAGYQYATNNSIYDDAFNLAKDSAYYYWDK